MTAADVYPTIAPTLDRLAYQFHRQHGGDIEELRAEANVHFVRAYHSYDPSHGTALATWVHTKVVGGLLDTARKRMRKLRGSRRHSLNDVSPIPERRRNRIRSLLFELSEDARQVIEAILDPQDDLRFAVELCHGEDSPYSYRAHLVGYLRDSGWTYKKIVRTFQEIREAL